MTHYQFTPQALDDLFEIWSYIAEDNAAAADYVEEAIYDACEFLARSPLAGRVRKDLTAHPVRFWLVPPFPNYFIVYDPGAKPLEVIRILHRARNIRLMIP
ncbi:MAG TPA: type II toxin-antitoxin system RelE/ParE family toxin [Candidatus Acidoferrum sp.]|nr:type II toxin-antitoxin system RelE/ParE family toxin [Candidatus Acidoferrum sp.]